MSMWPAFSRAFAEHPTGLKAHAAHHDSGREEFEFTVKETKHIDGIGLVVVGLVQNGAVHFGDNVSLCAQSGQTSTALVDGIKHSRHDAYTAIASAAAGEEVGLLFRELNINALQPGDKICAKK